MITAPGVNEFIDLSDAPHSYTGQASKVVKVNVGETAVEFGTGGGGGGGQVDTIVAGQNITVNSIDPANPIVSAYVGQIDGGFASAIYGATTGINGGNA